MYKKFLLIGSGEFVNDIKTAISGLALEVEIANTYNEIPPRLKKKNIDIVILDDDSVKNALPVLMRSGINFVVISSKNSIEAIRKVRRFKASNYIIKPYNRRELALCLDAILNNKSRVSCIGGGTGLFNLLMGLKDLPDILLTSIVSVADDGGSSGKLRESFGVLPPGDIRRSLVALSSAPQAMNDIMTYRFDKGGCFVGHSLGNLLLTALNKIKGSMPEAVNSLGEILNIQGIVRPISATESTLCALFEDGTIIKGESRIDLCKGRLPSLRVKRCWHEPQSLVDPGAYSSIMNSDIVTIGPGDLYTSVITNLLIKDIRSAITRTKAKKIYICNLMTKPGETTGFGAIDHIREILKYLKEDCLDYIIISNSENLSMDAILRYSKKNQFPVKVGDIRKIKKITRARIIIADVAHERELIRHDNAKIAYEIENIIKKEVRR